MAIQRAKLLSFLNEVLQPDKVKDYCPNGLQVEGRENISRLITGVTASQALVDQAIELNADAILVHHGYFWKSEDPCIRGFKKTRLKALLEHDINLFAYHLPLDIHPVLGNNAQLGKLLKLDNVCPLEGLTPEGIVMTGELAKPLSLEQLGSQISQSLQRSPLLVSGGEHQISSIAWCSGGGQGFIEQAVTAGVDAFFSGEISEQTVHIAREAGIHYLACGHHASERYGAKALGEYLQQRYDIDVQFIDIDNPA